MLERLLELQQRNPKTLFAVSVLVLLLFAAIASQLELDPSFSALVGKESEYNTNDRVLQAAFGANDGLLILVRERQGFHFDNAVRVDSAETAAFLDVLAETLKQSEFVTSVSPPEYTDDGRYARLFLGIAVPERNDGFKVVLRELTVLSEAAGPPPGIETVVTGLPVVLDRITTLLITDNLVTVLITLAFIVAILYWYSRDLLFTLITVSTPVASLVVLAAVMVLLDIDVTITLAAVGVLVLGLGADYSIHIATHYRQARREHEGHREAILHTIRDLATPITASFATTLVGFAALILGVSPSSQSQGIALGLAITIIFAGSFLIYPLLILIFGRRISVKQNAVFGVIRKWLARLAIYQAHHAKTVIAIVAVLTVVMLVGVTRVEFSTSNSNWIPDDDPVSAAFREINYAFGDADTVTVILTATDGDLRDVQTARDANRLATLFDAIPNIDAVESPYAGLPYDNAALFRALTDERSDEFNKDFTLTTMRLRTSNLGQDEAGKSPVLQEIRGLVERYPVHDAEVSLYGDVVRFDELGDSLQRDAGVTTMLGLGLVFLVASAIYASVVVGFLALLPIIIAVLWALGLMGYFGVPFTSLSTGIISLVLGIGVDFSIHLVDGITKHARKGVETAIQLTLDTAGSAIVLSSLTTFVGFLALTFATLLGTQRLGWSLAFAILSVFVVTLTLVPAIMTIKLRGTRK